MLAFNLMPSALPTLLGLAHVGPLKSALPPPPSPFIFEASSLDHVELLLPPRLSEPLNLTSAGLDGLEIVGDVSRPGTSLYLLTLDEASLNEFLNRRFLSDETIGQRYRNLQIDLQPGGLILYADVDLGLRWQRMGLLLLQEKEMTLVPIGLTLEDELYTLPDEGFLTQAVSTVPAITRQTLEALTLTGPLSGEATVSQVHFYADRVEILAQATYAAAPPSDTGWQQLEPSVELREINVITEEVSERLVIVRLAPRRLRFRVRYEPANPRPVSAWAAELQSLLVINAGYFTPENEAAALLISEGQRAGAPLGDFAGMFAVTPDGKVSVRWLRERPYDPHERLNAAVQSFPVLVKPGGVMGFPSDADEGKPSRRTILAQDRSGRILVIVAPRGYLSLHEMAVFLADSDLEIDTALNLDGGGSTGLWLNPLGPDAASVEIDSNTPVPSIVVVER